VIVMNIEFFSNLDLNDRVFIGNNKELVNNVDPRADYKTL
jgi:hypothetical protein